jgi:dynein heavy chain 1
LSEIRQTRTTFDTTDTRKEFGVCIIDYANAQSKVNAKYDSWQRDLLARYGTKLGTSMKDVYSAILKGRTDLESLSIDSGSTAQAVSFITFVQDLKRKVQQWGPEIQQFSGGQKTLERQRYSFPQDWLYVDQIQGEWSAFSDILKRKDDSIKEQVGTYPLFFALNTAHYPSRPSAQDRCRGQSRRWQNRRLPLRVGDQQVSPHALTMLTSRPLQGGIKAESAINTLNVFEGRLTRLTEDYTLVCRAKEALNLEHTKDDRLEPVNEEMRDLKAVWTALSGIWARLYQLRETLWSAVLVSIIRSEYTQC